MSQPKTLQEMDDNGFLAKVDVLMEHLERQVANDSVGDWAVSAIKAEIRRRIATRQGENENSCADKVVVTVQPIWLRPTGRVDSKLPISVTVFHVTLLNKNFSFEMLCKSAGEARVFLKGLEAAQAFGLPFERIPEVPSDS